MNKFITTGDPDDLGAASNNDLIQNSTINIFNSSLKGKTVTKGQKIFIN